jgi:hypothetical protein
VLLRIYTVLKVREKTLVQLEYEVRHTDNIVKIWSGVVNLGIYKGVLVVISDFLNVFVVRRALYVELSKVLMEASLSAKNSSSKVFINKIVDILGRQRIVNILGEKKS